MVNFKHRGLHLLRNASFGLFPFFVAYSPLVSDLTYFTFKLHFSVCIVGKGQLQTRVGGVYN